VSELNQVKTLYYAMNRTVAGRAGGVPALTFGTYLPMLFSACTQYDNTMQLP
jgi:hypothetical protein